jgi:hypothetical protein
MPILDWRRSTPPARARRWRRPAHEARRTRRRVAPIVDEVRTRGDARCASTRRASTA